MLLTMSTAPGLWKHLWCKVVRGANLDHHCLKCLVGPRVKDVHIGMRNLRIDVPVMAGEYLYVCGVAHNYTPRKPETFAMNLHAVFSVDTSASGIRHDGASIDVVGGSLVTIPALPDGFNDRDTSYTRCRNYQFAVSAFSPP